MSKRLNSFIARIGERPIVLAIAAISFVCELLNLRAPRIYGEPYLVAKNIVAGMGYVFAYPITTSVGPTCYVTPLYTYLQVPFLYFGLGARGIQVMNLLFLQAACFVLYRFFRQFASPYVVLLVFAALSFYIPFWILSYTLEPNSLNLLLLALTAECVYVLSKNPTRREWFMFGILIGVQLLVRPDIMLGAVLFAAWLLAWNWSKETWKGIAIAALVSLAIALPWTLRNYLTFHKFVLVSANAGMNLYEGNNPVATGEFSELPATPESRENFQKIQAYSKTHDQIEIDHFRLALAEEWMKAHPAEVLKLDAKKIWYHWFWRPIMGEQYHYQFQRMELPYKIVGVIMLVLGFYGIFSTRNKKLQSLFLVICLYSTLVSAIFFVQTRYRILKVDPFLLPLAVMGVAMLIEKIRAASAHSQNTPHSALST
ncbi:MAG TPA: hypothetical protein VFD13_09825 [Candidatus Kapabacteria bacterium]|nr:hypothetical protein [Candidatus Kapabacteria bacterium]